MYIIYGTQSCPYCDRAKELLTKKGKVFNYVDLSIDKEELEKFKAKGFRTVPQIYLGEELIGGYDKLVESFNGTK